MASGLGRRPGVFSAMSSVSTPNGTYGLDDFGSPRVKEGGDVTINIAVAGEPGSEVWLQKIKPVVLVIVPSADAVTLTWMLQEPFAATVPPVKVRTLLPGVAEIVPLQPSWTSGVDARFRPVGRVSVKPTPVSATPEFGLDTVNCKVVVPFTVMLVTANVSETFGGSVGGGVTIKGAVAGEPVSEV